MRLIAVLVALFLLTGDALASTPYRNRVEGEFQTWLRNEIWPRAAAEGVSAATFQRALAGVTLDWDLPDLRPPGVEHKPADIAWQAEFGSPSAYFQESRLQNLADHGRRLLGTWRSTLDAIEGAYGVPAEIIVAIWGRESSFGNVTLPENALRAIATQAFMGRRKTLFGDELLAALAIVEANEASPEAMMGSWAGAMGQPQFLPSKFHAYAVDFDRDGRRDIWGSVPDSLASIGFFLRSEGWRPERGWGLEVQVPANIPCTLAGPEQGRPMTEWAAWGVTRPDGRPIPARPGRDGFLFMPAGRSGPAFIVTENFYTLKQYNFSDNYALYIGHLGDRMNGAGGFTAGWGSTAGISRGDILKLQQHLEALGYDVGGTDGLVGFRTRIAIGRLQEQTGRPVTCFPERDLIASLP